MNSLAFLEFLDWNSIIFLQFQVFFSESLKGDNFKTGKQEYSNCQVMNEYEREIMIGTIPVMVKSNLCWLYKLGERECDFDAGGYFVIKGIEKVNPLPCILMFILIYIWVPVDLYFYILSPTLNA